MYAIRSYYATKPSPLSAAAILAQTSAEIDRLSAELDRKTEAYAKQPRKTFIQAKHVPRKGSCWKFERKGEG